MLVKLHLGTTPGDWYLVNICRANKWGIINRLLKAQGVRVFGAEMSGGTQKFEEDGKGETAAKKGKQGQGKEFAQPGQTCACLSVAGGCVKGETEERCYYIKDKAP